MTPFFSPFWKSSPMQWPVMSWIQIFSSSSFWGSYFCAIWVGGDVKGHVLQKTVNAFIRLSLFLLTDFFFLNLAMIKDLTRTAHNIISDTYLWQNAELGFIMCPQKLVMTACYHGSWSFLYAVSTEGILSFIFLRTHTDILFGKLLNSLLNYRKAIAEKGQETFKWLNVAQRMTVKVLL